MPKIGFDSDGNTPYVYIETQSGAGPTICSTAIGMDATDTNKNTFKIATGPLPNVTPETATPNFSIDPTADGDVTLRANGLGDINLISPNIVTTGGILQADMTTGRITIATGGTGIATLDGNSGSATGATVTIETANTNVKFVGSGATLTQDFAVTTNLALGSALPSLTSGNSNTAIGHNALSGVTSGSSNTGIGASALTLLTTGNENTCIGHRAGLLVDATANTIVGYNSGSSITTGQSNTILGHDSGDSIVDGIGNTIVGSDSGNNYVGTESHNILLGASGVAAENRVLRIGDGTGGGD